MIGFQQRTWVEISRSALLHNLAVVQKLCGPMQCGAVVKSNAYGHGLRAIASILDSQDSVPWLFTAGVDEALDLRSIGSTKRILAMAYIENNYTDAIFQNIDCAVYELGMIHELDRCARIVGAPARIHIKVDTGMTRLGIASDQLVSCLHHIARTYKAVEVVGVFTHLSDTNNPDQHFSYEQLDAFNDAIEQARQAGFFIAYTHALSSGGLLLQHVRPIVQEVAQQASIAQLDFSGSDTKTHFMRASESTSINPLDRYIVGQKKYQYDIARIGTNLYGQWKSPVQRHMLQLYDRTITFKPVLTWKSTIVQIKEVPAYASVGYNRTFTTERTSRIAIIPVGYWDGYPRSLSHRVMVEIAGHYAPVIGIISMNLIAVDITDIALLLHVGMPVTLVGGEGHVSATSIAQLAGTINNELLTRINPEIPRIVVE